MFIKKKNCLHTTNYTYSWYINLSLALTYSAFLKINLTTYPVKDTLFMRSYSHISDSLDNCLSTYKNSDHLKYRDNIGMLLTFYTSLNIAIS